jgi:hypothetical protein
MQRTIFIQTSPIGLVSPETSGLTFYIAQSILPSHRLVFRTVRVDKKTAKILGSFFIANYQEIILI